MADHSFCVTPREDGMPLQDFLVRRLSLSRRRAKALMDRRNVFIGGRRIWMARHRLMAGDSVQVVDVAPRGRDGDERLGRILYRDAMLLVVDKPAGCVTVGSGGLESQWRRHLGCASLCAAHRLDRDTTGCFLMVTDSAVMPRVIAAFRDRRVGKQYQALVQGRFESAHRTLQRSLDGASAVTHVHRLAMGTMASHLALRIETGRTHQIRRHLAAAGHPVLGDRQYQAGESCPPALREVPRQMLHAYRLQLPHPCRDAVVEVVAPLPDDFVVWMHRCGLKKKIKNER